MGLDSVASSERAVPEQQRAGGLVRVPWESAAGCIGHCAEKLVDLGSPAQCLAGRERRPSLEREAKSAAECSDRCVGALQVLCEEFMGERLALLEQRIEAIATEAAEERFLRERCSQVVAERLETVTTLVSSIATEPAPHTLVSTMAGAAARDDTTPDWPAARASPPLVLSPCLEEDSRAKSLEDRCEALISAQAASAQDLEAAEVALRSVSGAVAAVCETHWQHILKVAEGMTALGREITTRLDKVEVVSVTHAQFIADMEIARASDTARLDEHANSLRGHAQQILSQTDCLSQAIHSMLQWIGKADSTGFTAVVERLAQLSERLPDAEGQRSAAEPMKASGARVGVTETFGRRRPATAAARHAAVVTPPSALPAAAVTTSIPHNPGMTTLQFSRPPMTPTAGTRRAGLVDAGRPRRTQSSSPVARQRASACMRSLHLRDAAAAIGSLQACDMQAQSPLARQRAASPFRQMNTLACQGHEFCRIPTVPVSALGAAGMPAVTFLQTSLQGVPASASLAAVSNIPNSSLVAVTPNMSSQTKRGGSCTLPIISPSAPGALRGPTRNSQQQYSDIGAVGTPAGPSGSEWPATGRLQTSPMHEPEGRAGSCERPTTDARERAPPRRPFRCLVSHSVGLGADA